MSNKAWPYSDTPPSRILFPDGAEPAGIHVDQILQALASDTSHALDNFPFARIELSHPKLSKIEGDTNNKFAKEMRYNHLYEQDIQNRWFRGIAVVWEIAMEEKAPVLCVDGASADAQSLKFLKFLKAARLIHKGELWPLVEKDLGLFVHKYKKSLKENC